MPSIKTSTLELNIQRSLNSLALVEKRWKYLSASQRKVALDAINRAVSRLNDTNAATNSTFRFDEDLPV